LDVKPELQARLVGGRSAMVGTRREHEPALQSPELEFPLVAACNIKPGRS